MVVEGVTMAPPIGDNLGSFQRETFDEVVKGSRGDTKRMLFESNSLEGPDDMLGISGMAAGL